MPETPQDKTRTRPPLCPCAATCTPIYNGLGNDERLKTGDLNEGYSGDCIGKSIPLEYMVGGNLHRNDMNHCIFTPLKGVIRFQINEGDVEAMVHQAKAVLARLNPDRKCDECEASHYWTHFIVSGDRRLCCRCYYAGHAHAETLEMLAAGHDAWIAADGRAARGEGHSMWCTSQLSGQNCNCPMRLHAEIRRLQAAVVQGQDRLIHDMRRVKTVKVRIAVAVDHSGKWAAVGHVKPNGEPEDWDSSMDCALDLLAAGEARYWVEAELPIPETTVIQGEVSDA